MATVMRMMYPSDLRYTHDSVSRNFTYGYGLEETFEKILYGEVSITSLPNLVAMYYDSDWFVVRGNRRLYIYKQLETAGQISRVTVECVPFESNLFFRQYTTDDSGRSLRIRGNPLMELDLKRIVRTWNSNGRRRQQPVTYESVRSNYSNTSTSNYPTYSSRGTSAGYLEDTSVVWRCCQGLLIITVLLLAVVLICVVSFMLK